MSTRKIKIYTTLGSPGTIETNATTLADLKPELSGRGIDVSNMKLLIGETRNELSEDVALLPQGDFKLYLVPSKTKSGSDKLSLAKSLLDTALQLLDEVEMGSRPIKDSRKIMTTDEEEAAQEIRSLMGFDSPRDEWDEEDEEY